MPQPIHLQENPAPAAETKLLSRRNLCIASLWMGALLIVAIHNFMGFNHGWDAKVYSLAARSLAHFHDPYLDGIATQIAFHPYAVLHRNAEFPITYVYSPMTLPLLRAVWHMPHSLMRHLYTALYLLGAVVPAMVGLLFLSGSERRVFPYLAPFAIFLPGLVAIHTIFCGNIAYIFYGFIFAAAWLGWRHNRWAPFYLFVLAASVVKAPLLSLLVIPVFSARRQWLPAGITGAIGVGLFSMQHILWPSLFQNYLRAVELQFSFNLDFGISPAGQFGKFLLTSGYNYSTGMTACYLAYALLIAAFLFHLRRHYFAGNISLQQYGPLLVISAILFNPRIMEYDAAPLTLFMAIIVWRVLRSIVGSARIAIAICAVLLVADILITPGLKLAPLHFTETCVLVAVFLAGCLHLHLTLRGVEKSSDLSAANPPLAA